jgi:RimJ/RimL family protein N-acetyltransferase
MAEPKVHIETPRLRLRDWTDADALPFAALNGDPRVMEFFRGVLARQESDGLMAWIRAGLARDGYGMYAAEEKATGAFIGFIGVTPIDFEAHFTPAIEIGWRLNRESWGNGYATEGARAVVAHAFNKLHLAELVAITAEWNARSRRVMEKIGMRYDPAGDFLHPRIAPDHKLARHVLYRIDRDSGLR